MSPEPASASLRAVPTWIGSSPAPSQARRGGSAAPEVLMAGGGEQLAIRSHPSGDGGANHDAAQRAAEGLLPHLRLSAVPGTPGGLHRRDHGGVRGGLGGARRGAQRPAA